MTKEEVITNVRRRASHTRRYGVIGVFGSVIVGCIVLLIVLRSAIIGGDFSNADFSSDFSRQQAGLVWIPVLAAALTKVGSIFIAIYVVQILINFTKYNFRVADHLDSIADAMDFFIADERLLNTMLEAISPRHITFGKEPNTPTQDVIALVKEAMKLADKTK